MHLKIEIYIDRLLRFAQGMEHIIIEECIIFVTMKMQSWLSLIPYLWHLTAPGLELTAELQRQEEYARRLELEHELEDKRRLKEVCTTNATVIVSERVQVQRNVILSLGFPHSGFWRGYPRARRGWVQ